MYLTREDRDHLQRASEALLRPFEHVSAAEYLRCAAREIRPLLGAFASVCAARDPGGIVSVESDEWDALRLGEFARWKLRDEGTGRAIATGLEVLSMRRVVGDDWAGYEADPMVREWYKPNGVFDAAAYILHWPEDDSLVTIEWHAATFGTPRFGEEGEGILFLLLPSLRAGSRLWYTLGRERQSLSSDLDSHGLAVCVCTRQGRIVHQSEGLRRLLTNEVSPAAVLEEVRQVACAVANALEARQGSASPDGSSVHRVVDTPSARYRLSAGLAAHAMQFGTSDVLVTVSRLPTAAPTNGMVARFHLSRRELEVAELLARGARNDAIATTLQLSPHTVRRHTERVLAKLGVASRAEVAALLHRVHPEPSKP